MSHRLSIYFKEEEKVVIKQHVNLFILAIGVLGVADLVSSISWDRIHYVPLFQC